LSRRLIVRSAAASDINQAKQWYDSQRDGLGSIFVESLNRILQRIANNPEQFPRVHRELRRAAVSRFPYGIFYLHDESCKSDRMFSWTT
jgi:toxin ParE1/3/4